MAAVDPQQQLFLELAPWYVNGTLGAVERVWMDDYLRDHPAAASELESYESLRRDCLQAIPEHSLEAGWSSLQRRINESVPAHAAPIQGWRERLAATFRPTQRWRISPVLGYAALALLVIQAGFMGFLLQQAGRVDPVPYRSLTPSSNQRYLSVSFKAEATERDIRELMTRVAGTIVDGPGQLGIYTVAVPKLTIDIEALLRASPIVETADPIEIEEAGAELKR